MKLWGFFIPLIFFRNINWRNKVPKLLDFFLLQEADGALLRNLEYQIQSQFMQDDINSTRERHKKVSSSIIVQLDDLYQLLHKQASYKKTYSHAINVIDSEGKNSFKSTGKTNHLNLSKVLKCLLL